MSTAIGNRATQEDLEDAVERIDDLEALQNSQVVSQNPDWNTLFTRNGYFVFADDVTGEYRPDGLPVPSGQEVIYYNVVSAGKNGEAGHNQPTLILQRHGTLDVYFVSLADDSLITASRLVDSAELASAISAINDAFTALDNAIADLDTEIGNKAAQDDFEDAVERIDDLEALQNSQVVSQNPDWNTLFTRNGYFVFADDVTGEHRPEGLRVPAGEEVIYYNVVSAGKNSIADHDNPTLILQRHGSLEVYFVSMAEDNLVTAIRLVDSAELASIVGDINTILDNLNGEVI